MRREATADDICRAIDNTRYGEKTRELAQVFMVCAETMGEDALQVQAGQSVQDYLRDNYSADYHPEITLALLIVLAELDPQRINNNARDAVRKLYNPDMADLIVDRFSGMTHERINNALIGLAPMAH